MSAEIWQRIRNSVVETRPDLAEEFNSCRDRETIVNFMNKNFPLTEAMVGRGKENWDNHFSVKIPDMLKVHKWEKEEKESKE